MQFPAVNWHEGLFLQPHHFQAWDRHWTERVSLGEQWQSPYGYGIHEISINRDALASGFLQVDALRCKTPGGALVEIGPGQGSERRDLRPALNALSVVAQPNVPPSNRDNGSSPIQVRQATHCIDVYVGVPRLKLGNKNVDSAEHRNGARFRAQWLEFPDELDAACVKPVELRQLNTRILLDTDDHAGWDTLRIARVRRSEQDNVQVRLDSQYIPALMDCSAWELMRIQILSSLYDLMQNYSEQYSHQLYDGGGQLHASTPIEVQRLIILQTVNPAASVLQVLAQSRGIHPLVAYMELARLAGALDLLHPQRIAKSTAAYDHENLGGIFFELKRRILAAVEGLHRAPYRQYGFVGNEHGMQIELDRTQMTSNKRWFLGIRKGDWEVEKLHEFFTPGNLDWKLGSLKDVERLFTQRAPGVEIRRASSVPSSLPKSEDWVYYEILGLDQQAWRDVELSGSLAMRVRDNLIVNREQLPGQRSIQFMVGRQTIPLQFALFGVA